MSNCCLFIDYSHSFTTFFSLYLFTRACQSGSLPLSRLSYILSHSLSISLFHSLAISIFNSIHFSFFYLFHFLLLFSLFNPSLYLSFLLPLSISLFHSRFIYPSFIFQSLHLSLLLFSLYLLFFYPNAFSFATPLRFLLTKRVGGPVLVDSPTLKSDFSKFVKLLKLDPGKSRHNLTFIYLSQYPPSFPHQYLFLYLSIYFLFFIFMSIPSTTHFKDQSRSLFVLVIPTLLFYNLASISLPFCRHSALPFTVFYSQQFLFRYLYSDPLSPSPNSHGQPSQFVSPKQCDCPR